MDTYLNAEKLKQYHQKLVGTIPTVDAELDESSANAVQNAVVTSKFEELTATLGDVQSALDQILNGG